MGVVSHFLLLYPCFRSEMSRKFLAKGSDGFVLSICFVLTVSWISGYKVGRVDQAETALGAEMRVAANKTGKVKKEAGDKIVRRCVIHILFIAYELIFRCSELNKVYTNGTLVDAELILDEQAGHCVSIREEDPESDKGSFGVCVLDSSTSEFNMSTFNDDACCTKLETLMRQLRPKEILYTKVRTDKNRSCLI